MSEREDRSRLSEIMQVLRRYRITKGITPVKVREILEELGPTYVKLGQILSIRTDLISSEYCKELQKLRSQVSPMPYDEVRAKRNILVDYAFKGALENESQKFSFKGGAGID